MLYADLYSTSSANATNLSSFSMTSFSNMFVTDTDRAFNAELSDLVSPSWKKLMITAFALTNQNCMNQKMKLSVTFISLVLNLLHH